MSWSARTIRSSPCRDGVVMFDLVHGRKRVNVLPAEVEQMKAEIHPTYYPDAKVTCATCGKTWTTGSTHKELRVDICSNCHPFFSGEAQRLIDIEGQVDRFYKKLSARQTFVEQKKAKEESQDLSRSGNW